MLMYIYRFKVSLHDWRNAMFQLFIIQRFLNVCVCHIYNISSIMSMTIHHDQQLGIQLTPSQFYLLTEC